MKRILMIAPYFVPDASVGTLRSLALANHLEKQGWSVDIVTISISDIEKIDPDLSFKLTPGVGIHRYRVRDVAGIYQYWVKFKNKMRRNVKSPCYAAMDEGGLSKARRSSRAMRLLWPLYIPDKRLQWAIRVATLASTVELAKRADCIYTSGPPQSAHIAGAILKRFTGKPLVLDLRDPWGNNLFNQLPNRAARYYNLFLEKKILPYADRIICNTPVMENDLRERLKSVSSRTSCVLNGFEVSSYREDGYVGMTDPDRIDVVYTGTIYGRRNPISLLSALQQLKRETPDLARDFMFEFIGQKEESYTEIRRALGLEDIVSFQDEVSFDVASQKNQQATVCLVLGSSGVLYSPEIPMKLYETIGLGKPVLALAIRESAIAGVLEQAGVEYYLADPDSPDEIKSCLKRMHQRWVDRNLSYGGNREKRLQFSQETMIRKLEALMLDAMANHREAGDFDLRDETI